MRLKDADELKKNFQDELCKGIACAECSMQAEGFCRVERWIDIAPTIEAEPTKHGRWIESWGGKWHSCSVCGGIPPFNLMGEDLPTAYCPHCGAKMSTDGKDEVEE